MAGCQWGALFAVVVVVVVAVTKFCLPAPMLLPSDVSPNVSLSVCAWRLPIFFFCGCRGYPVCCIFLCACGDRVQWVRDGYGFVFSFFSCVFFPFVLCCVGGSVRAVG